MFFTNMSNSCEACASLEEGASSSMHQNSGEEKVAAHAVPLVLYTPPLGSVSEEGC